MSNIPIEKQRLPVDLVEQIEHDIALGNDVPGNDLLGAIEQSVGLQLSLRTIVLRKRPAGITRSSRSSFRALLIWDSMYS